MRGGYLHDAMIKFLREEENERYKEERSKNVRGKLDRLVTREEKKRIEENLEYIEKERREELRRKKIRKIEEEIERKRELMKMITDEEIMKEEEIKINKNREGYKKFNKNKLEEEEKRVFDRLGDKEQIEMIIRSIKKRSQKRICNEIMNLMIEKNRIRGKVRIEKADIELEEEDEDKMSEYILKVAKGKNTSKKYEYLSIMSNGFMNMNMKDKRIKIYRRIEDRIYLIRELNIEEEEEINFILTDECIIEEIEEIGRYKIIGLDSNNYEGNYIDSIYVKVKDYNLEKIKINIGNYEIDETLKYYVNNMINFDVNILYYKYNIILLFMMTNRINELIKMIEDVCEMDIREKNEYIEEIKRRYAEDKNMMYSMNYYKINDNINLLNDEIKRNNYENMERQISNINRDIEKGMEIIRDEYMRDLEGILRLEYSNNNIEIIKIVVVFYYMNMSRSVFPVNNIFLSDLIYNMSKDKWTYNEIKSEEIKLSDRLRVERVKDINTELFKDRRGRKSDYYRKYFSIIYKILRINDNKRVIDYDLISLEYNGIKYANCVETMIFNLINYLVYDMRTKRLDYRILPITAKKELRELYESMDTFEKILNDNSKRKFNDILINLGITYDASIDDGEQKLYVKQEVIDNKIYGVELNGYYMNICRVLIKIFGLDEGEYTYNEFDSLKKILLTINREDKEGMLEGYNYDPMSKVCKFRNVEIIMIGHAEVSIEYIDDGMVDDSMIREIFRRNNNCGKLYMGEMDIKENIKINKKTLIPKQNEEINKIYMIPKDDYYKIYIYMYNNLMAIGEKKMIYENNLYMEHFERLYNDYLYLPSDKERIMKIYNKYIIKNKYFFESNLMKDIIINCYNFLRERNMIEKIEIENEYTYEIIHNRLIMVFKEMGEKYEKYELYYIIWIIYNYVRYSNIRIEKIIDIIQYIREIKEETKKIIENENKYINMDIMEKIPKEIVCYTILSEKRNIENMNKKEDEYMYKLFIKLVNMENTNINNYILSVYIEIFIKRSSNVNKEMILELLEYIEYKNKFYRMEHNYKEYENNRIIFNNIKYNIILYIENKIKKSATYEETKKIINFCNEIMLVKINDFGLLEDNVFSDIIIYKILINIKMEHMELILKIVNKIILKNIFEKIFRYPLEIINKLLSIKELIKRQNIKLYMSYDSTLLMKIKETETKNKILYNEFLINMIEYFDDELKQIFRTRYNFTPYDDTSSKELNQSEFISMEEFINQKESIIKIHL